MKKLNRNISLRVENRKGGNGFNIYLDFSGKREYLMTHRHNGLLYDLLKDGPIVADMGRWKARDIARKIGSSPRSSRSGKVLNMVNHLLLVIDDYMLERSAC